MKNFHIEYKPKWKNAPMELPRQWQDILITQRRTRNAPSLTGDTMTYEFFSLDGDYLETITTDNPEDYFGELAATYGVPSDEIDFEVVEEASHD